jgi:hypothetical protein
MSKPLLATGLSKIRTQYISVVAKLIPANAAGRSIR